MKIARLDNLPRNNAAFEGGESDAHFETRQIIVVEDDYDFVANNATDLTIATINPNVSADGNRITNFDKYKHLEGSVDNFRDSLCLKAEIKVGVDNLAGVAYVNYAIIDSYLREIASRHMPNDIVDNVNLAQLATDCGGTEQAHFLLDQYRILSPIAREKRYEEFAEYAYEVLGNTDGLIAEDSVLASNLEHKYVARGVEKRSESGVDGLIDWITTTGLKAMIDDATISIKDGTTTVNFIDKCVEIISKGIYG